jgi:hypothetical protein
VFLHRLHVYILFLFCFVVPPRPSFRFGFPWY